MTQYTECPKCGNKGLGVFSLGMHEQIFCDTVYSKGCGWYGPTEKLGYYKLVKDHVGI